MPITRAFGCWHYICTSALSMRRKKADFRVAENSEHNRMNVHNLASIFGPTLLGSESAAIDAQIRVTETIITYALDMFELGVLLYRVERANTNI